MPGAFVDGVKIRDVINLAVLIGGLLASYFATTNRMETSLRVIAEQVGALKASVDRTDRRLDLMDARIYDLMRRDNP